MKGHGFILVFSVLTVTLVTAESAFPQMLDVAIAGRPALNGAL